jgi:hypothetical protein
MEIAIRVKIIPKEILLEGFIGVFFKKAKTERFILDHLAMRKMNEINRMDKKKKYRKFIYFRIRNTFFLSSNSSPV